jgi:hypothetical protein
VTFHGDELGAAEKMKRLEGFLGRWGVETSPPPATPAEQERCAASMEGLYNAPSSCARPKGHLGKHNSIHDYRDWDDSPAEQEPADVLTHYMQKCSDLAQQLEQAEQRAEQYFNEAANERVRAIFAEQRIKELEGALEAIQDKTDASGAWCRMVAGEVLGGQR